ncbi:hypothetical protein HOY34_04800 [Xinfangfangia sp. D13-10-4-6]|uniref:I78 family peptidase inhibitor n=1 Tax=Pseudogemmobacter hezensis TaxID=2737662 RepID=UPI0015550EE7|nr:I78 family peptidase inhibitor [Pseudogemmobacter hezensis]NPD14519.1 hypothetical protein [Pseudogemmobacter hezensis]
MTSPSLTTIHPWASEPGATPTATSPFAGTWRGLVLLAALGLSACSGAGDTDLSTPPQLADPALCGADLLANLTGAPATSLPGDEVDGPLRLIRPGDPVTRDYIPNRLNVTLDATDHIRSLTCG